MREMCTKFLSEILTGRDYFEDLDVDEYIILRKIEKEYCVGFGQDLYGL
jgi:hypothetical protein